MTEKARVPQSNPFATKFIRAGALSYRFPDNTTLDDLVARLAAGSWRGQIVGPHGSGKSTLLKSLNHLWESYGRQAVTFRLQPNQRTLGYHMSRDWSSRTQVIVDGYQQLSWISKCRLRIGCRRVGCGLVISAHSAVFGLPVVWRTQTSAELAKSLMCELMGNDHSIADEVVEQHFERCQGNLRETWLRLYDEFAKPQEG